MLQLSDIDENGNECLVRGLKIGNQDIPQKVSTDTLNIADMLICYTDEEVEQKSVSNRVIQQMTKGIYGHVGIVVSDDYVIHATSKGIHKIKIEEFIEKYTLISIIRDDGISKNESAAVVRFLLNLEGGGYNKFGAVMLPLCRDICWKSHYWLRPPSGWVRKMIFPFVRSFIRRRFGSGSNYPVKSKYFCSELALAAFNSVGRSDFSPCFNPLVFSPNDFINQNTGLKFKGYLTKHESVHAHEKDINFDG